MSSTTAVALVLAFVSTTLTNLAYLREHDAAAALPLLALRRPLHSARILLADRSWLLGFAIEMAGFVFYATALALASLALVQSISAGGIGLLAYVSARRAGRRLGRREHTAVLVSVLGLLALAVSLAGGSGKGEAGATDAILLWLCVTAGVAAVVLAIGRSLGSVAAAYGLAGGLLFSIGDISTKIATQGGARLAFVFPLIVGYSAGTGLIQIGYQSGAVLTVAGLSTLLTNAVPIAAATIVLLEPVPGGTLGVVRVLAFLAVTIGAVLLAQPQESSEHQSLTRRRAADVSTESSSAIRTNRMTTPRPTRSDHRCIHKHTTSQNRAASTR